MNAIADALVYAVSYINCRALVDEDDELQDDDADVGALESIAEFLHTAAAAEEDALSAAAERALAAERQHPSPRPEFLEAYGGWMEAMFGDAWHENRRLPIEG